MERGELNFSGARGEVEMIRLNSGCKEEREQCASTEDGGKSDATPIKQGVIGAFDKAIDKPSAASGQA
jgi:hypothetical protein